jgi:putative transcriptional regulator
MKKKLISLTLQNKTNIRRRHTRTDWARIDRMSEAEIEANALADPDNPPLTRKQLAKFKPVHSPKNIDVKAIRFKLHLSQIKFASYFGVSVRTIQDWEQHRHQPSRIARNFLLVIAREPLAVQRALEKNPLADEVLS